MKIMIAVLNQGDIHTNLVKPLLEIQAKTDHELTFFFSDLKPIDYNRNFIVDNFLKSDCELLFMMDSDMVIDENILDMVHPDYDVVSAVVFTCKNGMPYPILMKSKGEAYEIMADPTDELTDYTKVGGIGTGCIYIRRSVFEKIKKPYFRFQYDDSGKITMGEDYSFSKKIIAAGINPYVATKFIVGHYKMFDVAHVNQLLYKALTFNKNGIAKTLADRMEISAAQKISQRLKDGN